MPRNVRVPGAIAAAHVLERNATSFYFLIKVKFCAAASTGIRFRQRQDTVTMPTIDTIAREILDFEGFAVRIRPAPAKNGGGKSALPGYKRRYNRIAWNTFTVNDWRRRRFADDYPDHVVEVLKPDGSIATGKTGLAKLRELYSRATN